MPDPYAIADAAVAGALAGLAVPGQVAVPPRRRVPRVPKPPVPGMVFGFDENTLIPAEIYEAEQLDVFSAGLGRRMRPVDFAALLPPVAAYLDQLGPLRSLIDPPERDFLAAAQALGRATRPPAGAFRPEFAVGAAAAAAAREAEGGWDDAVSEAPSGYPDVQGLLREDHLRPHMLGSIFADHPEGPAFAALAAEAADASRGPDPFRPYSPEAPLASARGAGGELAGVLGFCLAQPALPLEEISAAEAKEDDEASYDLQTAQVAVVLRRFVQVSGSEASDRDVTLDDLIPPSSTERATAARTFAALLTLATAGDFRVVQHMPYGPIAVSLP